MSSLMQRRRALMVKSVDPTLLYSLEKYSFTDISKGIPFSFLANGHSRTLVIDIQIDQNPTSSNGSQYKFARSWGSNGSVDFSIGKNYASSSTIRFVAVGKAVELSGTTASPGRKRILLSHEADANVVRIYAKMDSGNLLTSTLTGTYASSGSITIGGAGGNMIKSGLINKYQIYDRILTQKEIDAFFA